MEPEHGKMKAPQIRDARESDRDAIREVTLSAFQEYAALMPAHWENYRKGILTAIEDPKPAEQIVAEQDGALVGAVLLYPAGAALPRPDLSHVTLAWPEIRLLAVSPTTRGQGIGALLMRECVRRARRSGAAAVTLHSNDTMQAGIRMYERMGFIRAPELDFHAGKDITVKGFRLDLDDSAP
jgi:predicted N-acetyltransferase YhbS